MLDNDSREPSNDDLKYLWTEYKYRHELCWQFIYKISAAVIALGVLPYQPDLTKHFPRLMEVPPIVGAALAFFGIFVLDHELRLFEKIKVAYRVLQNQLFEALIKDPKIKKYVSNDKLLVHAKWDLSRIYALVLASVLFLLSLANVVVVKGLGFHIWPKDHEPSRKQH